MDFKSKLAILADAAKYDASCASGGGNRKNRPGGLGDAKGSGICHSYTPDGRCISLLKILLTNSCIYDCSYCINRVSSSVKRAKFTVDEIVSLTMNFYRRNYIEGLFLSSGVIKSSDETMEEMVDVARKLRVEQNFNGYIHLKAVAGCSRELIEKAGLYADRLSANIELPTQQDLNQLAPAKKHLDIEKSMSQIKFKILETKDHYKTRLRKFTPTKIKFAPAGQSTQMIVGATPSSDRQILDTSNQLYRKFGLRRVYYSAFSPIPDSDPKLPLKSPPLIREHRLYQADWLMRFYGFNAQELTTTQEQNLNLKSDPKLAWALRNRNLFPVDVNLAPREVLLRVPGFGIKNVERIIELRRFKKIKLEHLAKMHVPMGRAKYFVITADQNLALKRVDSLGLEFLVADEPEQLQLFEGVSARTGQL